MLKKSVKITYAEPWLPLHHRLFIEVVETCSATSRGVEAEVAPALVACSTAGAATSKTTTSCPAFSKLFAICPPIFPKPINPTLLVEKEDAEDFDIRNKLFFDVMEDNFFNNIIEVVV